MYANSHILKQEATYSHSIHPTLFFDTTS